ncbi:hypothetical protein E7T06_07225 [Deinococcus sp. Arct2-2]|uniref:hypothetical protein n=1 Tax=Deinococcus sp. Arct2-2 TaxID=2568653 RepID=UPI0010A4192A|nr:hypothetical protein [Deinococcus sp. Arct2-2]THF70489.1 hypothetical protein E7T06_07225 [Deinococcus sp. Arct2-2]
MVLKTEVYRGKTIEVRAVAAHEPEVVGSGVVGSMVEVLIDGQATAGPQPLPTLDVMEIYLQSARNHIDHTQ